MKKLLTLAFVCLAYATSFGQNVPQGIAYQAVAVKDGAYSVAGQNPQAIYWSNKDIKVRFTIFDTYPNGSSQYSEAHTTSTDEYGVFNLIIGQGVGLSGDFGTIPWELGDAHLQVEIDFENTNTFTLTALEKFWSVPYAFVTNETGTSSTDSALAALDNKFQYLKDRDKDTVIGNEGIKYSTIDSLNDVFNKTIVDLNQVIQSKIDAMRANDLDTVIGNEIQSLSIKGDSLTISKGNTVSLNFPKNMDNDSTNEIQTISLVNDTIILSDNGGRIPLVAVKSYLAGFNGNRSTSKAYSKNYSDSGTNVVTSIACTSSSYPESFVINTRYLDTLSLKAGDILELKYMRFCAPNFQSSYCYAENSRVCLVDSSGSKVPTYEGSTDFGAGYYGCFDDNILYEIKSDGDYILISTSKYRTPTRLSGVGLRKVFIYIN